MNKNASNFPTVPPLGFLFFRLYSHSGRCLTLQLVCFYSFCFFCIIWLGLFPFFASSCAFLSIHSKLTPRPKPPSANLHIKASHPALFDVFFGFSLAFNLLFFFSRFSSEGMKEALRAPGFSSALVPFPPRCSWVLSLLRSVFSCCITRHFFGLLLSFVYRTHFPTV